MKREYAKPIIVFEDFTLNTTLPAVVKPKQIFKLWVAVAGYQTTAGIKVQFLRILRPGVL